MRLDNFVFISTGNLGLTPSPTNLLIELRFTSLPNGGFPVRTSQQVIAKLYMSAFPLYSVPLLTFPHLLSAVNTIDRNKIPPK
jgi:hypothetical protein